MSNPGIFIPNIYRNDPLPTEESEIPQNIIDYVNGVLSSTSHQQRSAPFETFEGEDLYPSTRAIAQSVQAVQEAVDSCIKTSGGSISGPLHILHPPSANFDATNKEYVDWLFSTLKKLILDELETKVIKNFDIDMNHFRITNLPFPKSKDDACPKQYVDSRVDDLMPEALNKARSVFSKGVIIGRKTFFLNPGFVVPQDTSVVSIGLATSPYKLKLADISKGIVATPLKLFTMVNNEVRSEYVVEKDSQIGYIMKEFEQPLRLAKGDNLMLLAEQILEDAAITITFV